MSLRVTAVGAAMLAAVATLYGSAPAQAAVQCDAAPAPGVDWRTCDKSGQVFSGNLTNANLQNGTFKGTSFAGSNLTNANFVGANLTGANLSGANVTGADFSAANLTGLIVLGGLVGIPAALPSGWSVINGKIVAEQTITVQPVPNLVTGTSTTIIATATSDLPRTFTSLTPTVCVMNGSVVTANAAGTCQVRISQPGNDVWRPATPVTVSFTVTSGARPQPFGSRVQTAKKKCVRVPGKVKRGRTYRLGKAKCKTNAGQKVAITVTVFEQRKPGSVSVTRKGRKISLRAQKGTNVQVSWTAPGTAVYQPFQVTKKYFVR